MSPFLPQPVKTITDVIENMKHSTGINRKYLYKTETSLTAVIPSIKKSIALWFAAQPNRAKECIYRLIDSLLTSCSNANRFKIVEEYIMQPQTNIALEAIIEPEFAGLRLDQTLAQLFPDYSRERLKSWVLAGQCRVDGNVMRPKDKVVGGEQVVIAATVEAAVAWEAEDLPLDIIYEDEDLIVINKSSNVVVHPAAGNRAGTLVNALLNHDPELIKVPRAGIVHRLDKDTSGLLVVARNLPAHTSLINQLQARTVTRIYEAVVHGVFLAGSTICEPIGRHPRERKKMAVIGDGKPATTHYRVLKRFAKNTHIQVQLETGRTHQIRVHMAHVRHPIVGDGVYAPRIQHKFPRQALHARNLSLTHPRTGLEIGWEVPIPADMQNLIKELSGCNDI